MPLLPRDSMTPSRASSSYARKTVLGIDAQLIGQTADAGEGLVLLEAPLRDGVTDALVQSLS